MIDETKTKISKGMKKLWTDPKYRKRMSIARSKAQKKNWSDPKYKKKLSAKLTEKWKKRKVLPIERFKKMYIVDEETGCWNWNGGTTTVGYGIFWADNKNTLAHRWYWQYLNKQILPRNLFVCHHCDNQACVNPDHFFIGSGKDNMQDALKKGRGPWFRVSGQMTR